MTQYKAYKIRLKMNNKQISYAKQHCGVARHAWNWGLEVCQKAYRDGKKHPSSIDLHKLLVRDVKPKFLWYYDASKCSPQQSLRDLETAYKRFFKKTSKHPKFKKRGVGVDSFYLEGKIVAKNGKIKLPKFGWVRLHENINVDNIKNCVISRRADFWFIAFKVEYQPENQAHMKPTRKVGVDLGINTLATLSDGKTFENPKAYRKNKQKLKHAQKSLSRKYKKGQKQQSKNYEKQRNKVARIHYKIACIRIDSIHKLTTYLAKNHSEVVIENLSVKNMLKNHKLAGAISDCGFGEFRRQMGYKCTNYKTILTFVDRYYPSSKTCSSCQTKKDKLLLSQREFNCDNCGLKIDRDLNASLNLLSQSKS